MRSDERYFAKFSDSKEGDFDADCVRTGFELSLTQYNVSTVMYVVVGDEELVSFLS